MRIAQINITPLIDVMLVLLILFMLVVPMAPHSLDAAVPRPATEGASSALVLTIDETGYALNRTPAASLEEIGERLRDAFRASASPMVLFQVRGVPSYGRVIEAVDVAQGAGAERLSFLPDVDHGAAPR